MRPASQILSSPYVDADSLLRSLPLTSLHEVRAVLLERLERHRDALRILVHALHQPRLAEEYCDR